MLEINASDLTRFMACNPSRLLGGSLPPSIDDPSHRNEGTAAHWVANTAFSRNVSPESFLNQKAPNGVIITQSILKSVADYYATIKARAEKSIYANVEQECSFEIPNIARINARCDFFSWGGHTLCVDDFKHGFRIVEPKENWPMIAYLIGICKTHDIWPSLFRITVHQPRVAHPDGPVRFWELTREELDNRAEYLACTLANPSDKLKTGNHCHRCPSQTICPAFRAASYNAVDVSMIAHAETITDEMIALELATVDDAEKRLKSRKKQLEDLAAYRIKNGSIIDGYALERSYSHLAWNENFDGDFLTAITGKQCSRPDVITPTQAINAGANEQLIKSLSSRKETGLKLNRVSTQKLAEKLFGKLKG